MSRRILKDHRLQRTALASVLLALAVVLVEVGEASRPPWARRETKPPVYPELLVSAKWLEKRLGRPGVVVVDARAADAYASGHITGALPLSARDLPADPSTLGERFAAAGVSSEGTVVCYADGEDAAAAGELLWLLELAGHRDVRVLNGGLEAWVSRSGAVNTFAATVTPASFTAELDTARIADFDFMMNAFGRQGRTILDWRSAEQWDSGHIPHSLPFPLPDLVTLDGKILNGPDMRPAFRVFGPRKGDHVNLDDEFIVCGDAGPGDVGVHPYLAARLAGIENVRCYREGFSGWREHPRAPVVRIVKAAEVKSHLGAPWWKKLLKMPPKDAILFDLRAVRDFETGHIPGAIGLNSSQFAAEFEEIVSRHWRDADRATIPVIFYCYGTTCIRSRNCSTIAAQHGFQNLLWFRDGIGGWYSVGGELVSGD